MPNNGSSIRDLGGDVVSIPDRPRSGTPRKLSSVDPKNWPKFDGSSHFDVFITKFQYFMMGVDIDDDEKARKLVELIKGRAFAWLSQQPGWMYLGFEEVVELLRKEYGSMKTKDIARLNNLKCGGDINKFNDEFNKIG